MEGGILRELNFMTVNYARARRAFAVARLRHTSLDRCRSLTRFDLTQFADSNSVLDKEACSFFSLILLTHRTCLTRVLVH